MSFTTSSRNHNDVPRRKQRRRPGFESLEQRLALAGDVFEVDDTAALAKPITTDGVAQGRSFHVGSDIDWVKFTLTATSNVTVETDGVAGGDTEMRLFGPNNSTAQIAYDDDSGNGYYSRIQRNGAAALAPGTYYLRLNEYGGNNVLSSYSLRVTATPAPPPSNADVFEVDDTAALAKPITTDGVAQGRSFHVGSDIDWVKFTLTATSNVTVETDGVAGGDTEMRLFGPNNSTAQIAYDDDSGNGYYSRIQRNGDAALTPGTYYVRLNEYGGNNALSSYSLRVTATPLVVNVPIVVQGEDGTGGGQLRERSNASGNGNLHRTRWIQPGEEITIPFDVVVPGVFRLSLRHSRDSRGANPTVLFAIDGQPLSETITALSTNDLAPVGSPAGTSWNYFRSTSLATPISILTAGRHWIRLRVQGGDIWGLEVDQVTFSPA
ncbi:MAG: DVUA0089 family protein [Isosphaeraceae bacterium]